MQAMLQRIFHKGTSWSSPKKKMSNTNADNVAKKFPRRDVFLPTKRKYMKESSTNVGNAVKNFLQREILLFTKGLYMKE